MSLSTEEDGELIIEVPDGEDTAGGFEAEAWGTDQLNAMLDWDKTNHDPYQLDYYSQAVEIARKHQAEITYGMPSEEEINVILNLRDEEENQARSAAKLTEKEMIALARQAVASVYGLTDEQMDLIKCPQSTGNIDEDGHYYGMEGGKPVYNVWFYLHQAPADNDSAARPEFMEKDGIYVIDVNVETGEIEATLYDSGLCANE